MKLFIAIACVSLLAACTVHVGNDDGGGRSDPGPPAQKPNTLDWGSVSPEFNPSIDSHTFDISNSNKIKLDLFGNVEDVRITYSAQQPVGQGTLKIYKVWKRQASWGAVNIHQEKTTLVLGSSGQYQCSIKVTNAVIQSLEGGCYVRFEIVLPTGAQVEVYQLGQRISKRFIVVTTEDFLDAVNRATWLKEKMAIIDDFIDSYQNSGRTPRLLSSQLGTVLHDVMRDDEKLEVLRRLHPFVADRENLGRVIDDEFTYFRRKEARAAAGLPE